MAPPPDRSTSAARRYRRAAAIGLVAAAAGAAWIVWRHEAREPAPARSNIAFQPNADQRRKLDALRARLDRERGRFAPADLRDKTNAKLFMYMAATSDEPAVVEASLDAVLSTYSSRSTRKEAPDEDLDRVLVKHLRSPQGSVAYAAFRAARVPLMSARPPPALVSALLDSAGPAEPAARPEAALQALDLVRPDLRTPEVLAAFEGALAAPEPQLVSLALFALAQSGPSLRRAAAESQAALGRRVMELTEHGDPGVRGRALELLEELWWLAEPGPARTLATAKLADDQPYVRARAASLLAKTEDPSAIHDLIAHVGDLAVARYELSGWTALDGSPGHMSLRLPGRSRVAESVLEAIRALSAHPPAAQAEGSWAPFVPELNARVPSDADLRAEAEHAKSWYGRERKLIPRATPVGPEP